MQCMCVGVCTCVYLHMGACMDIICLPQLFSTLFPEAGTVNPEFTGMDCAAS